MNYRIVFQPTNGVSIGDGAVDATGAKFSTVVLHGSAIMPSATQLAALKKYVSLICAGTDTSSVETAINAL